jgi:HPt (histidine-containing phosphotransfer) domain-containing protein
MSGFIAKPFDVDKAVALIMKLTRHLGLAAVPRAAPLNLPSPSAAENLPGIAVAKALATWHDAARYQKFLHLFAQRYADIVPALRGATIADAQALAHKFRGAAGNLGLDDVAGAALALEQLIKSNESPEPALLGLQAAMAVALDSIARYAAPVEPAPVQGDAMHNPLAQQLPGLLTAWQSDSSSEVARVLETMRQSLPAHSRELLQTALDNYDFRAGEAATMGLMPARPELKEET